MARVLSRKFRYCLPQQQEALPGLPQCLSPGGVCSLPSDSLFCGDQQRGGGQEVGGEGSSQGENGLETRNLPPRPRAHLDLQVRGFSET